MLPLRLCLAPPSERVQGLALSHSECRQTSQCPQEEKRERGRDWVLVADVEWLPRTTVSQGREQMSQKQTG